MYNRSNPSDFRFLREGDGSSELIRAPIIAISGKKYSGKSSVAEILASRLAGHVVSFAQPIREMLEALARYNGAKPLSVLDMKSVDKEVISPHLGYVSYRRAAQSLGDWGRRHEECFWAEMGIGKALDYSFLGIPVVIDDLRTLAEYTSLNRLQNSPFFVKLISERRTMQDSHDTERELPHKLFDVVIDTDSFTPEATAEIILDVAGLPQKSFYDSEEE